MSKTTPEEAKALMRKHCAAWSHCDMVGLAALIDEVRGVDAEPVGTVTITKGVGVFEKIQFQLTRGLPAGTHQIYTHPAPPQPATQTNEGLPLAEFVDKIEQLVRNEHQHKKGYPECSGNQASCPENEGFGCCGGFNPAPSQPAAPVELPPLPKPRANIGEVAWCNGPIFTESQMREYAQAAIAAGRKAS